MNEFSIEKIESKIILLHIEKYALSKIFYFLVNSMFYNHGKFISYTVSENEISLFIDEELINDHLMIINNTIGIYQDTRKYSILQIYENCSGISHIGIVAKISKLFSKNKIPIIYINTYNNNFILIHEDNFAKTKLLLFTSQLKFDKKEI